MSKEEPNVFDYLDSLPESHTVSQVRKHMERRLGNTIEDRPWLGDELFVRSAYKAFQLMLEGRSELQQKFTFSEMISLLNICPSPTWEARVVHIDGLYADSIGIEPRDLRSKRMKPVVAFLRKLASLSVLGSLALIDFCETWWRTHGDILRENPDLGIEGTFEVMGLELIDSDEVG